MRQDINNALSIDLEDWFHAELIRPHVRTARPERRVEWATEPILVLLKRYGVRATFFVVGDVLRHHRALVRRIYDEGHEIGCHGWSHRTLWSLDAERFDEELEEFDQDVAEILPPDKVVGFRAPTFSLDERTSWALDVLRRRGYRYDSSIFPVRNYLYGVSDAPPRPYRPTSEELTVDHPTSQPADSQLVEFPMTVCRLAGMPIPISGGFYLRVIPQPALRLLLGQVNAQGHPFVIYVHPWEADSLTPRMKDLSWTNRLVTYYNARSVLVKLEDLLKRFRFAPLCDVLGIRGGRVQPGRSE
jgi:polysaccharide deacetylase family protein (PEP-CTERM system associated)